VYQRHMNQQNIQQNQQDNIVSDVVVMPPIEENVPVPRTAKDALPEMSQTEEIMLRAQTIKEVSDITGEEIAPNANDMHKATQIATEMVTNPEKKHQFDIQPSPTIAVLGGIVGSMNHMIVEDLADLKLYVVNKLVEVAEKTENFKERTAALRAIGEVDGVDAFKKRIETTAKVESMEEVERELLSMLNDFRAKGMLKPPPATVDAELIEEVVEETKEQSFDDIMQEAADGTSSGE